MLYVSIVIVALLGLAAIGVLFQRGALARRFRKPTQTDLDIERAEGEGMVARPRASSLPH